MIFWANLLLKLNPATLDATQRLRLVSTVANYLRLPMGFVYLFSRRENFTQQQQKKKLRVCRRGGLVEKPDVSGDVAELLWPVGCPGEERLSDLATLLEHSVQTGGLERLLGAPVFEWRMLCAPEGLRHKVKRDLQRLKFVPTSTQFYQTERFDHSHPYLLPLKLEPSLSTFFLLRNHEGTELEPTHTEIAVNSFGKEDLLQHSGTRADTLPERVFKLTSEDHAFLHTSFCVVFFCSDPNWFSVHNSGEIKATEVTSDSPLSTSEYFWATDFFSSPFLPERVSTVSRFVGELSADAALLTSVPSYPSLPLTPAPYSVASALTHEAIDGASRASRLTLRPHLKETSLWTEDHRANHTESERRPTVSSQGHFIFSQEPTEDPNIVKPTLHNLPSVSHPPLTETRDDDVLLLASRLEPTQSPPPSKTIPTTQLFPDVSPTSCLTTGQLSITRETETAQHLSPAPSVMNQEVTSQMNLTTRDVSSTTSTGPQTPSGEVELESSLTTSLLEPSVTMLTPALPSELGLFSGQLDTPNIRNTLFSVEFVKASPASISLLQTLFWSLLPDSDISSLQQNLKSKVEMDFQSELGTELNLAPNGQTQTLFSGIFLTSLLPLQRTKSPQIISVTLSVLKDPSFEVGSSVKSTHERLQFLPSMKPTLVHTLQLEESQQIEPVPESQGHFKATAPSTAQEPRTTSPIHLMQSLEPSFPLCGPSVAKDHVLISGCTPPIKNAYLLNTTEHVLLSLTSYSPGEKHWMALPSQFFTFDSSGHFFSTQTSVDYTSSHLSSISSGTSFSIKTLSTDRRQSSVQPSSSSSLVSNSLNLPPRVLQSIPVLVATVGFPFLYSIPPETFLDPEDGEADALSLEIRLIDGPPLSVGTWLALDGLELCGVPLEVDLQFAPQHLLLVARDRLGLSATLPLTLDLRRSPFEPCHVFTLTTQRSLHSILRHRHTVDLLLTKLSRFFNSSGSHQLAVVSVAPGSTVVSWYNRSMCETGQMKTTRCHADLIHGMWLVMVSADGSVHREFREAMLPEFPITKVGPVSYRQVCFPTTPPPTFGSSTPPLHTTIYPGSGTNTSLSPTSNTCFSASTSVSPTSQQTHSHRWMAGMFTALLVVCLLILIAVVVAAVLHFCKDRGRSRTVAVWRANRLISGQGRDRRAIRPRRPPLFQPELPPPPLRLWIDLTQDDGRPLPIEQGPKPQDKVLQPCPIHYDFSNI
ncbi:hypothetical protein F2P81_018792 [Scophthalmus maximus]|uniref:Peptidase S72 domain-containing protein n=2 Tax=Scophthalmus maximus TaxID=52904 RepID=A0A6A4S944_SCOMX|nr:hypothetical protein F2P81_018792 [Scophthalmus maximus]